MIFNRVITEENKIEMFIEESKEQCGIIFKSYYNEENNDVILNNLYYDKNGVLYEANISQKDLGIKSTKNNFNNPRYIMITGSDEASHGGRMKVSLNGVRITQNNKLYYISIYRKNDNEISYDGNLKNIGMSNKEYKTYVELFLRNEDLIWSIYFNRGKFGNQVDTAFIKDEDRRRKGMIVKRDRNTGNGYIYDKNNNLLFVETIEGEIL